MRKILGIVFSILSCFLASGAADTINGAGGWQSWSASGLNNNGTPYWDNTSWDGANKNVGWCMAGSGAWGATGCTINPTPGTLPYWGTSAGGAITDVWFGN